MEDLRTWLEHMRSRDIVRDVLHADPHLEVGAITDLNAKRDKWVLLFDQINGYDTVYRILTGSLFYDYRVDYRLDCDAGGDSQKLVQKLRSRLRHPAATEVVSRAKANPDAPVFQNEMRGTDV